MTVPFVAAQIAEMSHSRRVVLGIVLLPGFTLLSYSALIDVLRHGCDRGTQRRVDFDCRILGSAPVRSSCGVELVPAAPLPTAEACDLVVVLGGREATALAGRGAIIDGLRLADARGATLVGSGSGLFLLIEAGFFDGAPCATDWYGERDRDLRFAGVEAVGGRDLVVAERRVSCAGGAAALALGTWLIERHCGPLRAVGAPARTPVAPVPVPTASNDDDGGARDPRVRRALGLIERNLARPMRVEAIAAAVGLSKRQLERLFHQLVGRSVQQYSRDLRIGFGLWLLVNTGKSITDVALEAGFSDSSHFNRLFRTAYGMVPSEARRGGGTAVGDLPLHWQHLFARAAGPQSDDSRAPGLREPLYALPILLAGRKAAEARHPR